MADYRKQLIAELVGIQAEIEHIIMEMGESEDTAEREGAIRPLRDRMKTIDHLMTNAEWQDVRGH